MGKGKDLFGKYNDIGKEKGPGSDEYDYSCTLFQALLMIGERRVFELLEEGDEQGKKIQILYSKKSDEEVMVPAEVRLI